LNPTLTVLLYSSLAAAAGVLGAIPPRGRAGLPVSWIGWANALAAGLMLGAAFMLTQANAGQAAFPLAGGALLGIFFTHWTHAVTGTSELDLNRLDEVDPTYGYRILLTGTLHSASEGVAIGAAMYIDIVFGISMAAAIAVHNVPEAAIQSAIMRSRGATPRDAAGLAVAVNVSQVLLAVVTFAVLSGAAAGLPWATGFAVGALTNLVLVELLPESYRQAGSTSIALVTLVAMGMVAVVRWLVSA
jgi:ZIP family zinc transporter